MNEPLIQIGYTGQKETKVICDRTRSVTYNGEELHMNTYMCSSCNEEYHFEQLSHWFCPFCGTRYVYEGDVSV